MTTTKFEEGKYSNDAGLSGLFTIGDQDFGIYQILEALTVKQLQRLKARVDLQLYTLGYREEAEPVGKWEAQTI